MQPSQSCDDRQQSMTRTCTRAQTVSGTHNIVLCTILRVVCNKHAKSSMVHNAVRWCTMQVGGAQRIHDDGAQCSSVGMSGRMDVCYQTYYLPASWSVIKRTSVLLLTNHPSHDHKFTTICTAANCLQDTQSCVRERNIVRNGS